MAMLGVHGTPLRLNLFRTREKLPLLLRNPLRITCSSGYASSRRGAEEEKRRRFGRESSRTPPRDVAIQRGEFARPRSEDMFRIFPYSERPFFSYYVTCPRGFEEIVAAELSSPHINAMNVNVGFSGVSFCGSLTTGYRANLWLRCGVRVLMKLAEGEINPDHPSGDTIYHFTRAAIKWSTFLEPENMETPSASLPSKHRKSVTKSDMLLRSRRDPSPHRLNPKARHFSVDSHVSQCDSVNNSHFASTRVKDAICDSIRSAYHGQTIFPPQDHQHADLPIFVSLFRNNIVIYRDMSGTSLHKRGYRDVMHKASLKEGTAAAILTLSGFNPMVTTPQGRKFIRNTLPPRLLRTADIPTMDSASEYEGAVNGKSNSDVPSANSLDSLAPQMGGNGLGTDYLENMVLLDPMCGSGTFLIEAALMATQAAPGLFRSEWPFEKWHDFNAELWSSCVNEAQSRRQPWPKGMRLLGNDIHSGALSLCEKDATSAGVMDFLELTNEDIRDFHPSISPNVVYVNPPWGARLESYDDYQQEYDDGGKGLIETWTQLGLFFKSYCRNANVFVLCGNSAMSIHLHLKATQKWGVDIGGILCKILYYSILPPKKKEKTHATLD